MWTVTILQSMKKLTFLKICILDIGAALGDVATDILLGFTLLFGGYILYGILVLSTCWLPLLVMVIHMRHEVYGWFRHKGFLAQVVFSMLVILCFPLVPIVLYVGALLNKKNQKQQLLRANKVKSIMGVIEAPIQIVIVFMLMFKGVLDFPWNKEVFSECFEDELKRTVIILNMLSCCIIIDF
jgi:hypothetical protein